MVVVLVILTGLLLAALVSIRSSLPDRVERVADQQDPGHGAAGARVVSLSPFWPVELETVRVDARLAQDQAA